LPRTVFEKEKEAFVAISHRMAENLERSSWIRRMSDEGQRLKAQLGAESVFDFSLGNPDIEPPPAFDAALARVAAARQKGSHGYMPNTGYPEVRAAVAARASLEQGLDIPASNIAMTVGAAGGLNVVLKTILDPGDEVVVIRPYFGEYLFYVENHGGVFIDAAPRPDFSPDPGALASALTERTACLIINSPNNPTGRIYSRADLDAIAGVLAEHGRKTGRMPYLIADEPYRAIAYGGAAVHSAMEAYPETIVVSSWSKSLSLPGERIGYVAVSPRCADAAAIVAGLGFSTRVLGFVNAPALMQRVVACLLDEVADVESYAKRGRMLSEGLEAAGYEFSRPEGAFYIFARVPELPATARAEQDALGLDIAFVMHLKRHNIIAVPGVGFGFPGWFRLSFCVSESTILGSLPHFAQAMEEWKRGA
jgi:aspartate aminotransferase